MSLDTTLAEIASALHENQFPNEQAISQGIVLRVLRELGWDTYDTTAVWPEFQTGEGRADFALCHPPSKPAIFIEVKHLGRAVGAVKQALEYAFHWGVPFVVLTDGRTWSFYLPAEQGNYEERRVYMLDLYERSPGEAAESLRHYLAHDRVVSGESLAAARTEYRSLNRRSQTRAAIPDVWRELVQKRDARLIEFLLKAVESKVGFPPEADDIAAFLNDMGPQGAAKSGPGRLGLGQPEIAPVPEKRGRRSKTSTTMTIRGTSYSVTSIERAMVTVLRTLAEDNPQLLEHCARDRRSRGRKNCYLARTRQELYPGGADKTRNRFESLPGGWLVAKTLPRSASPKFIQAAVEIAGLQLGQDVIVPFDELLRSRR